MAIGNGFCDKGLWLETSLSLSILLISLLFCFSVSACYKRFELVLHVTLDSVQSCRHDGWYSVVKYLIEDVPLLLKLEDLKDVQNVLSMVFKSPPADLREFIKWIAEVRRQEDGSLILSDEEKGRIAIKVFYILFDFIFFINSYVPVFLLIL